MIHEQPNLLVPIGPTRDRRNLPVDSDVELNSVEPNTNESLRKNWLKERNIRLL